MKTGRLHNLDENDDNIMTKPGPIFDVFAAVLIDVPVFARTQLKTW